MVLNVSQCIFSLFYDPPPVICGLCIVWDPRTSQVQMLLNFFNLMQKYLVFYTGGVYSSYYQSVKSIAVFKC